MGEEVKTKIRNSRNAYTTEGDRSTLTIVSASGCQHTFQFDADRLEAVQTYCWRWEQCGPCASLPEGGKVLLQRLLMQVPEWDQRKVKFINGDRSDMRLVNMRIGARLIKYRKTGITRKNTTGFTGVYHRKWHDATGRFRPFQAFTGGRKKQSLGHFARAEDAAEARARWIKENGWTPKKRGRKTGWRKVQPGV
jgi:hypothetical protein